MDADTNICAVILNYNDAQTTMKLTESWKDSKVIRNIIIVDNCSTDDSWERLGEFKEEFASDHTDNSDNLDKVQLHLFRTAKKRRLRKRKPGGDRLCSPVSGAGLYYDRKS